MSKVSALQASLEKTSGKAAPSTSHSPASPPRTASLAAMGAHKAPSREGKIHIGAYLPADFKRSLRLVQAQTGEDVQTLLTRALNDLFKSHNVPVIES